MHDRIYLFYFKEQKNYCFNLVSLCSVLST